MLENKKIGIVVDEDFALKHLPPFPRPSFYSYENPYRIKFILDYMDKIELFNDERIIKRVPKDIDESVLELAHSKYYINSIKQLSRKGGGGLLGDEVFVVKDTYSLAKKAVGGAIEAIESVLNKELGQSIALIRPPGHHATREKASGLCIFNNIANAILYLRKRINYKKKIAIIDIDDHFGDGLCQYFYEDPNVLYFSIHEFDFVNGDVGDIDELGEDEGRGTNINFPIPMDLRDNEFLEFMDILEQILKEYRPDLIIIATGLDMYFADPIGNCLLTSISYYKFTEKILKIAEDVCEGKLAFILEGGYSLIGLPVCIDAIIKALLNKEYKRPDFENKAFPVDTKNKEIIDKIKFELKNLLKNYWLALK